MTRATALALLMLALVAPAHAADRRVEDATQRMLDAMTSHDLCARDDAQLRRLNRTLSVRPARPATPAAR